MSVSRTHSRLVVKLLRTIVFLFLCTIPCVSQTRTTQHQLGSHQPALKEVLSWLPDDTETVIGSNGPFPVPDLDTLAGNDTQQTELPSAELELRMRAFPLGLFGLKNGGLQKAVKGKSVAVAVEGSRHFRPPAALGEMRYEGCEIVVFDLAIILGRDSFMKNAANSAVRFEDMAGLKVAVFEEPMEDDRWTTFVAFPRLNIVVVATEANYLRAVLARMGGASGPRALPESLPEWKYVNTQAPAWG